MSAIRVLSALSFLLVAAALPAQGIVYSFDGDHSKDYFGHAVASAGDVNGDGLDEILVGAYGDDTAGNLAGSVRVFSGLGGVPLYTFYGSSAGAGLGRAVAGAGDVDGDGFGDFLLGAELDNTTGWAAGSAWVYSGWDGRLLFSFYGDGVGDEFGQALCALGDVNGDGHDDFLITASELAYGGGDPGYARVFSGADGAVLYALAGTAPGDDFGVSAAALGDLDGDGITDFVLGASREDTAGNSAGRVYAFSGVDGSLLWSAVGDAAGDQFGHAVTGLGDVDGDGVPDAAAGAPQTLAGGTGWVRALSGVDGATLWTVTGTGAYEEFGRALAGAGDVDGDGDPDLAVGSAQAGVGLRAGSVRVYDGTTGAHVLSLHGGVPGDQVGWSVAGVGDLDFDGRAEIATGLPYADSHGADAGRVLVFGDTSPDLLGPIPGLAGSINTLHVSEVPAGAKVVFLYGTTAGLAGSPLCAGVFAGMADPVVAGHAFADGNGYAFLNVSVPGGAAGRTFLVQAFVPSTCQVSNLVVAAF